MQPGTNRMNRHRAMRDGDPLPATRESRVRLLPTKHRLAALPSPATREYQSDSSSKQPGCLVLFALPPENPPPQTPRLTEGHSISAWYRQHGIQIQRILTDNGNGYVSHLFAELCRAEQIRHHRTRPYTPRTNGKAERFIQTSLRSWAYAKPYVSSLQRLEALPCWLHYYNHHRPHASLGRLPPASRVNNLVSTHS